MAVPTIALLGLPRSSLCAETDAWVQALSPPGPDARMNSTGATGISDTQRAASPALGAVHAPG